MRKVFVSIVQAPNGFMNKGGGISGFRILIRMTASLKLTSLSLQSNLGSVHLSLFDGRSRGPGQLVPAKRNGHGVDSRVRRPHAPDNLVDRDVRLALSQATQREAALLQLGLGVVPVLVHDELVQAGEEADAAEGFANFQPLMIRREGRK